MQRLKWGAERAARIAAHFANHPDTTGFWPATVHSVWEDHGLQSMRSAILLTDWQMRNRHALPRAEIERLLQEA